MQLFDCAKFIFNYSLSLVVQPSGRASIKTKKNKKKTPFMVFSIPKKSVKFRTR